MEAMRDVGVRRVVFVSSGAIYGDQAEQPLRESLPPNPRSPYAVSKLAAEYYVNTIGDLWNIETVCLRVFNAYGPGQHLPASHPPVVPYFLRQALRNGTLVVHGDGSQTRDYVYVDDVVSALIAASTAPRHRRPGHQHRFGQRNLRARTGQSRSRSDRQQIRSHLQPQNQRRRLPHVR